jgi:predicted molibdopterin-dependent oxidoreductase YjgC
MIRERGQEWRRVTWNEALQHIADTMAKTVKERGADKIMVLSSARGTNEENYVAQKFVRAGLGTHNIDCCARVCHAPTAAAMRVAFGTGAARARSRTSTTRRPSSSPAATRSKRTPSWARGCGRPFAAEPS